MVANPTNIRTNASLDCPCDGRHFAPAFCYDAPPEGEVRFKLSGAYRREFRRCDACGHFLAMHQLDLSGLYSGGYVEATYGSADGLRHSFEHIVGLPPERSDNSGRVRRIATFAAARFGTGGRRSILDIGSGLGVFPHAMKQAGWTVTALDPDPRAIAHLRDHVGVAAVAGDFMTADLGSLGQFDVVAFNKVLEHVERPVAMLARARPLLRPDGFAYIELPDALAAVDGPGRQEFFIDHFHVFSPASLALLAERAGFRPLTIERLREPSGKYTLRGFIEPAERE
jgi:SAM-dependent methyltransferase